MSKPITCCANSKAATQSNQESNQTWNSYQETALASRSLAVCNKYLGGNPKYKLKQETNARHSQILCQVFTVSFSNCVSSTIIINQSFGFQSLVVHLPFKVNSKLIGSKHPSLLIEVQINTCCQSTHLSSWQVATINPGADPIIPMNISQCPLARDAIRQVVHTGIKFTQEEFLGGIYLYSKNVRVHPGPLYCFCPWLFPHVSVPAPNFQPSIRNSWPGYP